MPGVYPGRGTVCPPNHRLGQRRRQGPEDLALLVSCGVTGGPFLVGRLSPSGSWAGRWRSGAQATPAGAESRSTYCALGPQQ